MDEPTSLTTAVNPRERRVRLKPSTPSGNGRDTTEVAVVVVVVVVVVVGFVPSRSFPVVVVAVGTLLLPPDTTMASMTSSSPAMNRL